MKIDQGLLLDLDEVEVSVLRGVATEVLEIITGRDPVVGSEDPLSHMVGISTNDRLPDDPILARLFPDAYKDKQLSSEFRRYTETSLQSKKQEAIARLLNSLPLSGVARIELETSKIDLWIRAINDLRLVLGVVLAIDEDSDKRLAEISEQDPEFYKAQVFYWLGWMLESLLEYAAD